ncbi:hypothetical protein J4G08_04750 [Candidatus Poribacteria bacterium]|nr:hypothetical protein [Candidatus Poribacteria bacterium]
MKHVAIFLTLMLILCTIATFTSLLKASPGTNRGGTEEVVDPPPIPASVTRTAYDGDVEVWSSAGTKAWQGIGHQVKASTRVRAMTSQFLKGTYTVSATLNHDWVIEMNKWDGRSGEWRRYLNKGAYTSDMDWFNMYDTTDTIEYCLADGYATARDVRESSKRWSTSVYIPW